MTELSTTTRADEAERGPLSAEELDRLEGKLRNPDYHTVCSPRALFTKAADALAQARLSPSLNGGRGAPEGWKLVPVEPTERMVLVGADARVGPADAEDVYCRMLAACPLPPEVDKSFNSCTSERAAVPQAACPAGVEPSAVDETAWLIEETWSGYVHYIDKTFHAERWRAERDSLEALPYEWVLTGTGGATLTVRKAKVGFITKDPIEAMRFPTKEAAEAWIAQQPHWFSYGDQFQAREHMWPALSSEAPPVEEMEAEGDSSREELHEQNQPLPATEGEAT